MPTPRSEKAKLQNNTLVGTCNVWHLRTASRISKFPKTVKTANTTLEMPRNVYAAMVVEVSRNWENLWWQCILFNRVDLACTVSRFHRWEVHPFPIFVFTKLIGPDLCKPICSCMHKEIEQELKTKLKSIPLQWNYMYLCPRKFHLTVFTSFMTSFRLHLLSLYLKQNEYSKVSYKLKYKATQKASLNEDLHLRLGL